MATESILKNVKVKSNSSARKLVSALEQSQKKSIESASNGNKVYHNADKDEMESIMRSIPLSIEIPEMVRVNEKELKILLATKLYEIEMLSLGQAAKVAGLSKRAFIEVIGQYGVSLFSMSVDELQQDIANA